MSDTLSTLAKEIETEFVAGLKGLSLTPDEAVLVSNVVNRLAANSVAYPAADSTLQPTLKARMDEDIATLANIAVAKQIDAQVLLQRTVLDVIKKAVAIGLETGLGAIAALA